MNPTIMGEMIYQLQNGVVEVTFEKINDGGTRVMPCTINPEILESETGKKLMLNAIDPNSDNIAVWGMDVKAWRSFRVSTVTGWKVIEE